MAERDPGKDNAPAGKAQGAMQAILAEGLHNDHSAKPQRLLTHWRIIGAACRDSDLSHGDTAVLWAVLERVGSDGTAWPSYECIAEDAGLHRSTVGVAVKRLVDGGYLSRVRGGFGKSNRYRANSLRVATNRELTTNREVQTSKSLELQTSDSPKDKTLTSFIEPATSNQLKSKPARATGESQKFAEFWAAYPRHIGPKAKAEASWKRQRLDRIADSILAHVRERTANDPQWQDKAYIPYPTTFLNGQRWNDEWRPASRTDAHSQPATTADADARANEINEAAMRRLGVM